MLPALSSIRPPRGLAPSFLSLKLCITRKLAAWAVPGRDRATTRKDGQRTPGDCGFIVISRRARRRTANPTTDGPSPRFIPYRPLPRNQTPYARCSRRHRRLRPWLPGEPDRFKVAGTCQPDGLQLVHGRQGVCGWTPMRFLRLDPVDGDYLRSNSSGVFAVLSPFIPHDTLLFPFPCLWRQGLRLRQNAANQDGDISE
jgi:hypothetical protein